MIHFSGIFQLAAINKEDVTKNNTKVVYFTCFSRRGEESDRVFCKVFGSTAEYLMRNLVKKSDGSYKSRKMYLAGHIETYDRVYEESLPQKLLSPSDLPPQYGVLKMPIGIIFTREAKEQQFCFRVSFLEFEDKKKETETIEIVRATGEQFGTETSVDTTHYSNSGGSLMNIIDNANSTLSSISEPNLEGIID